MPRRSIWTDPVAAGHDHRCSRRRNLLKRAERFVDRRINAEERLEPRFVARCDVRGARRPEIVTRRMSLAESDRGKIPVMPFEQPPSGALFIANGTQQSLLDVVRPCEAEPLRFKPQGVRTEERFELLE